MHASTLRSIRLNTPNPTAFVGSLLRVSVRVSVSVSVSGGGNGSGVAPPALAVEAQLEEQRAQRQEDLQPAGAEGQRQMESGRHKQ